jgi:putative nucleotidyltransferase with HDIG domain
MKSKVNKSAKSNPKLIIPAILPIHPVNFDLIKKIALEDNYTPSQSEYISFTQDPGFMGDIYKFQTDFFNNAQLTKGIEVGCFPGGACPEIKESLKKCSFIWTPQIMFTTFGPQKIARWILKMMDREPQIQSVTKTLDYKTLLFHSRQVAWASKCLATHVGMTDHEIEAVTLCGLLHDIGKFVTLCPPNDMVINTSWQHQESGAFLADKWVFPQLLHQTLLNHHRPTKAALFKKEVTLVFMANFLILDFKDLDWKNLFNSTLLDNAGLHKADIINLRTLIMGGLKKIV